MNKSTTIKIDGKDYKLKDSFRNLMQFEETTGKRFPAELTISDIIILFYVTLCVNNEEFNLTKDEFIDLLDNDPNLYAQYSSFILKSQQVSADVKKKKMK